MAETRTKAGQGSILAHAIEMRRKMMEEMAQDMEALEAENAEKEQNQPSTSKENRRKEKKGGRNKESIGASKPPKVLCYRNVFVDSTYRS